jgi:hypothetical protein
MSDAYDDYFAEEFWYQEDVPLDSQTVERNEEEFIFFGIFSGFFDWLFK